MATDTLNRKNSNTPSRIIFIHQYGKPGTSTEVLTAGAQIFTDFRRALFTHRFILPKARTARHNKNIQAVKPTFTNILTVKKRHIDIRRTGKYFSPINNVLASTALIAVKTCFYPWARNKIQELFNAFITIKHFRMKLNTNGRIFRIFNRFNHAVRRVGCRLKTSP